MGLTRYKPNRRGLRAILGSEGVRADLHARAEAVAEAAREEYTARPPHEGEVEVVVDSETGDRPGGVRARAAVIAKHPAVLAIEKDRSPLGTAMDAARL